jgi:CDP-diacylglycerol--glycerol-3-phosphate 3-phosphatidyltransferase
MPGENIYTIPNALSAYRLIVFPLVFFLAWTGQESWFALFVCMNLVTDVMDGLIARTFKMETRFGSHLDALADIGTYILALYGVFKFKSGEIGADIILLWIFLFIYFLQVVIAFIKFGKNSSLHLYGSKIAGYVQGLFFFVMFAWSYYPGFFYIAMLTGIIARSEEVYLLLHFKKMEQDVKGVYWVRREERKKGG